MAIDTETWQSPGWYLKRLHAKLQATRKEIDPLFQRFEGDSPLPESMKDAPAPAKQFFRTARTNFAEMVVKAVKYPLRIQGVLTDADTSAGDLGDAEAYELMRASGMAEEVDDVHRMALVARSAYAIVSEYGGEPRYTSEDPREVVTIHDPVVQSKIVAAAKFYFHDEDGRHYAQLYTPGRTWRAVAPGEPSLNPRKVTFGCDWDWDEAVGGSDGKALPISDYMPVFRYRNEESVGEFERHVDILSRIDHIVLQGMMVATLQAFKQRAIKVSQEDMPDEDEETGEEINYDDLLTADPGAFWKLPESAEIWESGNVDLTPVWTGMDKFIQQLSAVTFTPLAMFSPEGQNQSAAGAGFAREGRTFKIEDRQDRFGSTHARALAALFLLQKGPEDSRSRHEKIRIVWRPAERYSLAEKADAMTKYNAGGVPWRTRMIEVGQFTPEQVIRMEQERLTDQLLMPADVEAARASGLPAIR